MIELFIFILTYLLISVQNLKYFRIDRPSASTIGAALMLVFGVMTLEEAVMSIDYNTIILLFGMMVISSYMGISGLFDYLAYRIMKTAKNGKKLLFILVFSSGFLSAFFVNDIICVFMTPVVVRLAVSSNINPLPLLIALATSANAGSAATIVGNPQNMLIGTTAGVSFMDFTVNLLPASIVALLICYLLVYWRYRADLNKLGEKKVQIKLDRSLAIRTIIVSIFVFILFITEVYPIPVSALIGAAVMFIIGEIKPKEALEKVDWGLLLLFSNLFIVMHGFEKVYGEYMISFLHLEESLLSYYMLSFVTVIGSNLVSNVPFVMMALPALKMGEPDLCYVLAMSSTFAGNLTLIGSVANLIVAETAGKHGIEVSFVEYLKAGAPVTVLSVAAGTLLIFLVRV